MFLYLFRKSLVDFWDYFMMAVAYNLVSLGLVAFMAFSPYWAGSFWWGVCAATLVVWLALGPVFSLRWDRKRPVSLVRSLVWSGGAVFLGIIGSLAVGWYLSQEGWGAWIPGFTAFWLLLSLAGLYTILQFFTSLKPAKDHLSPVDLVFLVLSRPSLLFQSLLVSLFSVASLVIFLPGPAFGLFWGTNLREILEEAGTKTRDGQTPDWKALTESRNRELQKRSWLSLIFPWRE